MFVWFSWSFSEYLYLKPRCLFYEGIQKCDVDGYLLKTAKTKRFINTQ